MAPDANPILEEMNRLHNSIMADVDGAPSSDFTGHTADAVRFAELFDDLSTWITNGGTLPRDWAPRNDHCECDEEEDPEGMERSPGARPDERWPA